MRSLPEFLALAATGLCALALPAAVVRDRLRAAHGASRAAEAAAATGPGMFDTLHGFNDPDDWAPVRAGAVIPSQRIGDAA